MNTQSLTRPARLVVAAGVLALVTTGTAGAAQTSDDLGEVRARFETPSYFDDDADGNADADDPAIWRNAAAPNDSIVVGTLKNGGLTVFDLGGRELQRIPAPPAPTPEAEPGRFNNVDILQGVAIGGRTVDIAVTTDRGRDRLRTYAIDPRGAKAGAQALTDITSEAAPRLFSPTEEAVDEQRTGYGMALWADPNGGAPLVVVSQRHETRLGLFRLGVDPAGKMTYSPVSTVDLPVEFQVSGGTWAPCEDPGERPQVEGMVVDRTDNILYAAQEDIGIWRIPLSAQGFGSQALVDRTRQFGQPAVYDEQAEECVASGPESSEAGKYLSADAEGLTIAYAGAERKLVASSQGDSTFVGYRIIPDGLERLGGSRIVDDRRMDGVQDCDGAAVTTEPLGDQFPQGLLVVHDGQNTPETTDPNGETRTDTNFKLIRWEAFAHATGLS
ncbi:phytase [Saccharopolyspora shandongensis]|uniref:phytase n=1 Tax=Saccharopolyspora shandongensis TaxID=418495 RepID=UPI0033F6894A